MNGEITSGGIFLPGTENSPTEYDMIIGHKGDARHSPQENKDDEGHMFERRGEGIPHWIRTKLFGQFLPWIKGQKGRDDVLYAHSGIRAGNANQELDIAGDNSHKSWRYQSQKGEEEAPDEKTILGIVTAQEELLQIVAQCDRYDGEWRTERKDGKQGQEVKQKLFTRVRHFCCKENSNGLAKIFGVVLTCFTFR